MCFDISPSTLGESINHKPLNQVQKKFVESRRGQGNHDINIVYNFRNCMNGESSRWTGISLRPKMLPRLR